MTTISSKMIKDSVGPHGQRICTLLCRYPRWIHAEGRTHRLLSLGEEEETRTPSLMEDRSLSRNASSSRAIPVKKMIESIRADPAIPLFWGANQRGMRAGEEINRPVELIDPRSGKVTRLNRRDAWLRAMHHAIEFAEAYDLAGYHKQIANRLLEPFMHISVLVTATEWSNFFALRIHEAAEPHIRMLAEQMKQAIDGSEPEPLDPGDWHLPFVTDNEKRDWQAANDPEPDVPDHSRKDGDPHIRQRLLELSVARCAHLSYNTVGDEKPIGYDTAQRIYAQLLGDVPIHASPAEHQATPDETIPMMGQLAWGAPRMHGNFVGFVQYRKTLPNECL